MIVHNMVSALCSCHWRFTCIFKFSYTNLQPLGLSLMNEAYISRQSVCVFDHPWQFFFSQDSLRSYRG